MIVAARSLTSGHKKCDLEPAAARRMALIDSHGKIVAVNNDWTLLAKQAGVKLSRTGVGANYLEVCRKASTFSLTSHQALTGINQVIKEEIPSFTMDYTCQTPSGLARFRMNATQIYYKSARVAISHTDISDLELSKRKDFEHVQKFARRLINAQEEERQRISREIHDDLGGKIAFLAFSVRQMVSQRPRHSSCIDTELNKVVDGLVDLATGLRDLSHSLHPPSLRYVGVGGALKAIAKAFQENYGIAIDVRVPKELPPLSGDLQLCVFRICQESLQNIAKHSGASKARIILEHTSNQLCLTVSDSGKGFVRSEAVLNGGVGMLSMQERAITIGGNVIVSSSPGEGTEVSLTVPLQEQLEETMVESAAKGPG
jgi:signal transduction histidine kinase